VPGATFFPPRTFAVMCTYGTSAVSERIDEPGPFSVTMGMVEWG
jgi:hypothetical protein